MFMESASVCVCVCVCVCVRACVCVCLNIYACETSQLKTEHFACSICNITYQAGHVVPCLFDSVGQV